MVKGTYMIGIDKRIRSICLISFFLENVVRGIMGISSGSQIIISLVDDIGLVSV